MKLMTLSMAVAVVATWPGSIILGIGEPKIPIKFEK